jgi:hypothetical protein
MAMEVICKKTIPQITLLKTEEDLEEWKLSVNEVFKFYGMQGLILHPQVNPRKRLFKDRDHATFLLGLLSASVSPLAHRLVKAGWDFSDSEQDVEDLYDHVLKVIVPASQLPMTVAGIVRSFLASNPGFIQYSLSLYRKKIEDLKHRLDALGCPMDEKMAVCLVLNDLQRAVPAVRRELDEEMAPSDWTWSKLMERISVKEIH